MSALTLPLSMIGSMLGTQAVMQFRRKIPGLSRLVSHVTKIPIQHGLRKSTLRFLPAATMGTYSPLALDAYRSLRGVGEALSEIAPSDRVRVVRKLKNSLSATTHLKNAPMTGDLLDALKRIPEHELLMAKPKKTLFTVPKSESVPDSVVDKVSVPAWLGLQTALKTPFGQDIVFMIRQLSYRGKQKGFRDIDALVHGLTGRKPNMPGFGGRYSRFSRTPLGAILTGETGYDVKRVGEALGKDIKENPVAAQNVIRSIENIASHLNKPVGRALGLMSLPPIASFPSFAQAVVENPKILSNEGSPALPLLKTLIKTEIARRRGKLPQ
jgi:hypothetical protein